MRKYLIKEDVKKEIDSTIAKIEMYEDDIRLSKEFCNTEKVRLRYLTRLYTYLTDEALIPLCSSKILKSDVELQEFIIPLLNKKEND